MNKRLKKRPLKARDHQNVIGKEGNVKIHYNHIYGHKFYQQQNYMEIEQNSFYILVDHLQIIRHSYSLCKIAQGNNVGVGFKGWCVEK